MVRNVVVIFDNINSFSATVRDKLAVQVHIKNFVKPINPVNNDIEDKSL